MRRRSRGRRRFVEAELDLLPLMGLFVVLVPLLLLSAVFVQISVIGLNFPGDAAAAGEAAAELPVTVRIGREAYVLEAEGGARTLPRDDATLSRELRDVSARHPGLHAVTIVSEPRTRYEEIIAVMDVSRESGFPQVALAAALGSSEGKP